MRAKQFCYLCAGILMVAAASHVIAVSRSVVQSQCLMDSVSIDEGVISGTVGRRIVVLQHLSYTLPPDPIPGNARVLETNLQLPSSPSVIWVAALENGDVWRWRSDTRVWELTTNLCASTISVNGTHWGGVKEAYRK